MDENEKPKRGRPKGSKNRPKKSVESIAPIESVDENVEPGKIDNAWRRANNYLLPVHRLDYCGSQYEPNKTLLGFVEGYGDWDFGVKYPYFTGHAIKSGNGAIRELPLFEEEIINAFCALGLDNKPVRLYLFGRQKIGPNNRWSSIKNVIFEFGSWKEEFEWMEP
jgi:hypothetical protein